jgi:hypothetical protein
MALNRISQKFIRIRAPLFTHDYLKTYFSDIKLLSSPLSPEEKKRKQAEKLKKIREEGIRKMQCRIDNWKPGDPPLFGKPIVFPEEWLSRGDERWYY